MAVVYTLIAHPFYAFCAYPDSPTSWRLWLRLRLSAWLFHPG